MMKIYSGIINAPASKSSSLRALICCSLTENIKTFIINNISFCDDVLTGVKLFSELRGLTANFEGNNLILTSNQNKIKTTDSITINTGESGFLARGMVSLGTWFSGNINLTGVGTLMKRELGIEEFAEKVGLYATKSTLPVTIRGNVKAGNFILKENNSSQFLSGLLFTLPLLPDDSLIIIDELVSKPYMFLTLSYLERLGINFSWIDNQRLLIKGNQHYNVKDLTPESDWSSLSFIIALGVMKGNITITNIIDAHYLPDRTILNLLDEIGGLYSFIDSKTLTVKESKISGFSFDFTSNPDLAPVLVALSLSATSPSKFKNCYRLKNKESDRLHSLIEMLKVLNAKYIYQDDTLTVYPSEVSGGLVKTFDDHRIAMSALILNAVSSEMIRVDNYDCINKSYPDFLNDLKILGVKI